MKVYNHWSEYPMDKWRWPSFSPEEMASRGDGNLAIDERSIDMLQALRDELGKPMIVNSAYRSPYWNKRVGGAKSSYHMKAMAFDVRMDNHDPATYIIAALKVGFKGIGTYPHKGFVHVDSRSTPARWGKPFAKQASRFAAEPLVKPKTDATKKAAAATVVIAGAERVINEAAPALPDVWVTVGMTGIALATLTVIVWPLIAPAFRKEVGDQG